MVFGGVYVPALYVVRHGEPAVQGVMLGRMDPPLSEAGFRHAIEQLHQEFTAEAVVITHLVNHVVEPELISEHTSPFVAPKVDDGA